MHRLVLGILLPSRVTKVSKPGLRVTPLAIPIGFWSKWPITPIFMKQSRELDRSCSLPPSIKMMSGILSTSSCRNTFSQGPGAYRCVVITSSDTCDVETTGRA